MKNNEVKKDDRVRATSIIWGCAVGMLGVCIPLTAITKSGAIPVAVIIAAGAGTVAVWRDSSRSPSSKIAELEARIIDLETISSSLELAEEEKFKKLESN